MISRYLKIFLVCAALMCPVLSYASEEIKTLSAGVSLNAQVPLSLMGTWRVASVLKETDSPVNFKKNNIDIWNLSKSGDVITLSNPFTGATASIKVNYVSKNTVKFIREGYYDNQKLTDMVEITLNGDNFQGINILKLDTVKDDVVMKEKTATYILRGEKISGTSILER